MVTRVAVIQAPPVSGDSSSLGSEIGTRVLKRGVSTALGFANLGWAGDVLDLTGVMDRPKKAKAGISQSFRQQCMLSGIDPTSVAAKALERGIRKGRVYTIDAHNPEATFVVTLVDADIKVVDAIGVSAQPTVKISARLVDAKGKTIWQRQGTGSGHAYSWREYGARPALFRAEIAAASDSAAAAIAAQLAQ